MCSDLISSIWLFPIFHNYPICTKNLICPRLLLFYDTEQIPWIFLGILSTILNDWTVGNSDLPQKSQMRHSKQVFNWIWMQTLSRIIVEYMIWEMTSSLTTWRCISYGMNTALWELISTIYVDSDIGSRRFVNIALLINI